MLRLAQMQGQRFWVERTFQDGKSHAGLDHYQARGWRAWHHHMALVMMAMLFMLEERVAAAVCKSAKRLLQPRASCLDYDSDSDNDCMICLTCF